MGIFDRFPYSSTHEMNLDFMLGKATEIAEDMQTVTTGMAQVQAGLSAISEKTEQATQAAAQAAQSASSIEGSVTAAEEAAEEAQMHNESAQTWANNAMTYKADCQRSATEAAASATSAAQAATAAAASEDTVATYAQAANASAQSAANNNDSAHQYANQASASASNATFHSSNAQTAATNAQTAATNANTSATNASASADRAATLKTDVETLHRMCTTAVDLAAEQAVAAANSAAQAAATKTDVENLVESLPEDFTDLNNTVNQLSDKIADFEDAISQTEVIKSSNLFDIANATTGYYWSNGHVDSTLYNNTGYIEVEEGKTFTYQYGTKDVSSNRVISDIRFIAAYDANKNYVSSASKSSQTSYTVPNGIKYVILGIANGYLTLNNSQWSAVVYSTEVLPYEDYIVPYTKTEIKVDALPSIVRRHAYILATDTESEILEKLVDAYNLGNTDVFFERADYLFGDGLASVATTYNLTSNEIPIGNNCRYFFNGAKLTATIDLSQHSAVDNEEFYCNFFGCQRRPSSYELHDGVLIATDTRYVVHDESSALNGSYKHLYQNMEMHYHTNQRQETIRKCIGGGTGASGVVEIIGCKFTTDAQDSCVSFHGNGTDIVGAEFDLNVRDCWLSNSIRAGELSANQTGRFYYTGNSAASEPATYNRWTVTKFLNEVRT